MAGGRLSECPCGPALGGSKRPDQWGEGAHVDRVLSGSHTHSTPPSQRSSRVVVRWGLAGLLDSGGARLLQGLYFVWSPAGFLTRFQAYLLWDPALGTVACLATQAKSLVLVFWLRISRPR